MISERKLREMEGDLDCFHVLCTGDPERLIAEVRRLQKRSGMRSRGCECCGKVFVYATRRQRYCNATCRSNARNRRNAEAALR